MRMYANHLLASVIDPSNHQCFVVQALLEIKIGFANVKRNYYIFVKYNIRLINLQGK